MLVLSRKKGERIVISENIEVVVLEIRGGRVKLGFEAPKEVSIHRKELQEQISNMHPSVYHQDCC